MRSVDLTGEPVLSKRDVLSALAAGARELVIDANAAVTLTAQEAVHRHGLRLTRRGPDPAGAERAGRAALTLGTPQADAAAAEIVTVGRKLWQRQYVDGNGGNISCRLDGGLVLCTPTLVSKGELSPEDLCLVDLAGNQVGGSRRQTSEILLHLEIYRAVPEARAVVHSHPPHATAYAITGRIPADRVIPEYEVFVGQVGLTRYETPGTRAFAESVLPQVRRHNTLLLANHGVVCWAESVTRAEWLTEIVDTYCWILTLAAQMHAPLRRIPRSKAGDLVAIRRRMSGQAAGRPAGGAAPAGKRPTARKRSSARKGRGRPGR